MAKSLRSKFKRKIRAIARTKKAPKEHALLEATVARREAFEQQQAEKAAKASAEKAATDDTEQMDTTQKKDATINTKTMKLADGSYPTWLNPGQKKKLQKQAKLKKKNQAKKARARR